MASGRSLGVLTLDLVARIGGFEKGMDSAARLSEKRLKQIQATANKVGLAIGAAFGIAATGLVAFVKTQTEAIANYQDIAEKIGDTAEAVASIKNAADVSETSLDDVAAASVKLTAALSKTDDEGKGVGAALKALNINLDDFKKLSPVDQIDAVSHALAGFQNGAEKTAVAVALFGKSGAELLPFLNDLADGAERQKNLTQEQIDAANELQEAYTGLKGKASSLSQQLAAQVIPVVLQVVEAFSDLIKEVKLTAGDDSIKKFAQGAAIGFATTVEFVVRTIRTLRVLALEAKAAFNAVRLFATGASLLTQSGQLEAGANGGPVAVIKEALARYTESNDKADAALQDLLTTNTTAFSDKLKAAFSEQEGLIDKANKADLPKLKFSGIPPEKIKSIKDAKDATDALAASLDAAKEIQEEVNRMQEAQNKLLQEAASVYDATRTPLEKFNAEMERLNKLRDTFVDGKPLIDDTTYRRAVVAAQDDFHGLEDTTKEVTDNMSEFAKEAARNMQDAFANFLFDPFKDGLKGLVKNFADTLQRMAAEAAAAQIFKGFTSGATGSGGFLDALLSIGGSLGGSQSYGGAKALGGPVQPGKAYLVGENGPEMFSPSGSGSIIPNGAGMTVNQSFVINAPQGSISKGTQLQIAAQAAKGAARGSVRNN